MSTIKSSAENLTLNADGANNDIKFQSNGSEVASIDQAGLLTATSFAGSGATTSIVDNGNATAMTINNIQNIGIGTSSPTVLDSEAVGLHIHGDSNATNRAQIHLTSGTTGAASTDGMYIAYDGGTGAIQVRENQPLAFYTNASERLRILAGGGITFNGDTASANALDDYEEGTWTASFGGSSKTGNYTKIGRTVTVTVTLDTTASAFSEITGFPFSANGRSAVSICRGNGSSPSMTGLNYGIGGTTLTFTNSSGTATSISTSGTVRIDINGTYQTA
jgi:hypothetical protein